MRFFFGFGSELEALLVRKKLDSNPSDDNDGGDASGGGASAGPGGLK